MLIVQIADTVCRGCGFGHSALVVIKQLAEDVQGVSSFDHRISIINARGSAFWTGDLQRAKPAEGCRSVDGLAMLGQKLWLGDGNAWSKLGLGDLDLRTSDGFFKELSRSGGGSLNKLR